MNWHRLSIPEVFELLGTSQHGLSTTIAEDKLLEIGPNELQEGKKKSVASILLAQFKDVMILILMAAAIISGIIGDITDTIVILVIVLLNAVIGFLQEYRAEKAMQALKRMAIMQAKIMRDGRIAWLPATVLVPGDIVFLEAGNAVPADVRIIESVNLKIEEAALTGESNAVDKITHSLEVDDLPVGDKKNMGFKGTFVTYGRGTAVVIATGMQTELGRIAKMLQEDETLTPLQQRMASFGKKLSVLVLFLCVLFFVAGWLRGEDVVKMILTSISLAVAAIPEALPAVITISLALAAKRMIRLNSLIRKLPAVETLGSVTYICTDKTGTLTKNKMYVEDVFVNGKVYDRNELSFILEKHEVMLLLQAFALNNDSFEDADKVIKGDSTEIALLEVSREQKIQTGTWPRLSEIAFDADRKLMTTFHLHENKIISFTKGAPDILLQHCINIDMPVLQKQVDKMAAKGLRVLGFAFRYWDAVPPNPDSEFHESGLQFLGLAGIIDPPREEVFDAVAQCKTAGIIPVMITGDHPLTAKTIAQRIGILSNENDLVITGQELAALDNESFLAKVEKIKVYARVSPEQKLHIVKALQRKGHYVAMTGDGVNDAPSLKRANIGIAMGITGTDVSKEAAHMILLDDNFSTIVKAVREGRRIYDNILKFIKYLMTSNSGELWTLLIGPIIGLPVALLPIHILWINLVTDGLPAISLSFEKAEKNIMNRPPRPPQQSVFANGRGTHMIWVGMLMAGIALSAQSWAISHGLHWQTIVFNVLCLSQMGHVLAIRSESQSFFSAGIFSNKPLIGSVLAAFLLQFSVTYIQFLQPIFKTQALTVHEFILVGAASSVVFFAVEIEKIISRKYGLRK
ncbi:cation-translocating P-type ATPase [Ginsengibacter hankyongi]|uniref:Cation-translocating P-type ATPase n=1 Tax=Ginsengibacter hankyongi TaxID=2607284 RepID=A0A5J5IKM0_9BACT|nr:cation-translocating P-type ATPase [Ginsengibacter hankyongi]KAA9040587.1 cation-translocating P-type ATPase [Ginsengibacter hankyongi]